MSVAFLDGKPECGPKIMMDALRCAEVDLTTFVLGTAVSKYQTTARLIVSSLMVFITSNDNI